MPVKKGNHTKSAQKHIKQRLAQILARNPAALQEIYRMPEAVHNLASGTSV